MAKKGIPSAKHIQIDKANATVVGFVATAAFVTAFTLVASKAMISQRNYQARVIKEKTKALTQLKANNKAATELAASYEAFVTQPANAIGGNPTGTGDRDGDNAKIVLDALPSKYDFPALATSVEKMLTSSSYKINTITGIDDELNQSAQKAGEGSLTPIEMPFQINIGANFASAQELISTLQRSIRPINVSGIKISGSDNSLVIDITAKTYYQPEKTIGITTKVVK